MARDASAVFASLIGAAHDNFVNRSLIERWVARNKAAQSHGGKIVGSHRGEATAEAAERGADAVADKNSRHDGFLCEAAK